MKAESCPYCRAPVRGDGQPTCLCAAVGAEDFDPLRVRPYVALPEVAGDAGRAPVDGVAEVPCEVVVRGRVEAVSRTVSSDEGAAVVVGEPPASRRWRWVGVGAGMLAVAVGAVGVLGGGEGEQAAAPAGVAASGGERGAVASRGERGSVVLRVGADGPAVRVVQFRLRQVALYFAAEDDGRYDADVREAVARYQRMYDVAGDPEGVYGARTRASLEARTWAPQGR